MTRRHEFRVRVSGPVRIPPLRRYRGLVDQTRWKGGTNVEFDNARVRGLDMRGHRFWNFSTSNTRFEDCDFRETTFESGSWIGKKQTVFVRCRFANADLRSILPGNCRFEACDFSGARIDDWLTQAAEFVECRFGGRVKEARFSGRPWGIWEEPGQIEPPRQANEFRGNDFGAAELVGCSFAWGIPIGEQTWPVGPQYVRLNRWPERLLLARAVFDQWSGEEQREALAVLTVFSEAGYEFQDEIFVNKYSIGTPSDVADRIWDAFRSVLPS